MQGLFKNSKKTSYLDLVIQNKLISIALNEAIAVEFTLLDHTISNYIIYMQTCQDLWNDSFTTNAKQRNYQKHKCLKEYKRIS